MTAPNAPMSAEEAQALIRDPEITEDQVERVCSAVAAMAEREAALVKEIEALRADAERLSFLLTTETAVHQLRDTRLYMLVSIEGYPLDGSEHETPSAAIDAARAEARDA